MCKMKMNMEVQISYDALMYQLQQWSRLMNEMTVYADPELVFYSMNEDHTVLLETRWKQDSYCISVINPEPFVVNVHQMYNALKAENQPEVIWWRAEGNQSQFLYVVDDTEILIHIPHLSGATPMMEPLFAPSYRLLVSTKTWQHWKDHLMRSVRAEFRLEPDEKENDPDYTCAGLHRFRVCFEGEKNGIDTRVTVSRMVSNTTPGIQLESNEILSDPVTCRIDTHFLHEVFLDHDFILSFDQQSPLCFYLESPHALLSMFVSPMEGCGFQTPEVDLDLEAMAL